MGACTMGAIDHCLKIAASTLDVPVDQIIGPKKGAVHVTRARAVAAYLASTECGLSDQAIANHMKRDRASISHMLKLIESIRDHEQVDDWLDQITSRALCPPKPCQVTLNLLLTTNADDLLEYKPRPKTTTSMQWGADKILAALAEKYNTNPRDLISARAPAAIRHEAWRVLHKSTSQSGRRIFTQGRIAAISGVSQAAVSRALRPANRRHTDEV
jgi:chromosomal replication initiation ATPase DnaA